MPESSLRLRQPIALLIYAVALVLSHVSDLLGDLGVSIAGDEADWDPCFVIEIEGRGGVFQRRREMKYFAVVQARGKELDYLRGEAFRVAQDARIDWSAEPGNLVQRFALRLRT